MKDPAQSPEVSASTEAGSILLVAAILLGIAMLALSSILIGASGHSRINFAAYHRERAFLLADSGLTAAIQQLNRGNQGNLSLLQSHGFFQNVNAFSDPTWGFTTVVTDKSPGKKHIVSTGFFGKQKAVVSSDILLRTTQQDIHALYAFAIYAGNSSGDTNYVLQIGGTAAQSDVVNGDVYSGGDLELSGDAHLRHPEQAFDADGNGLWDEGEDRHDSGTQVFHSNALTRADFDAYTGTVDRALTYPNGQYDQGEAFIDTVGNGVYDPDEVFTDLDGDGVYGFGEPFTDTNGNGAHDVGEPFVDHGNGTYDAGEVFVDVNGDGVWNAEVAGWTDVAGVWHPPIPAEDYADLGNGAYDPAETFEDRNSVYDPGEEFFDDRNGRYDYGAQATGTITGMPAPGTGQQAATGGAPPITPPDLSRMYYDRPNAVLPPVDASPGWGHDVAVADAAFDANGQVHPSTDPAHIFVKNPTDRSYTPIPGKDDYFLEDPTDPSYGDSSQQIMVASNGNDKVYYVDGNLYIHNPDTFDFKFREPGVRVTVVANGNITISDEFRYNGGTANPQDCLSLIAMKDPACTNSGNIYLGDAQFGTGGDIHAMLFAENDFVDNNLNTSGQSHLTVFGNMTAGNHVALNRSGSDRTRLDVTLDERILDQEDMPPGLPAALAGQRTLSVPTTWTVIPGTWVSYSNLR